MSAIRTFEDTQPQVSAEAWLDPQCLVIGNVEIGPRSSIWPGSVIRGDVNVIRIGRETNIQDGSLLHVSHDGPYMPDGAALIVGDRVTVGHKVILHGCTIADRTLIGMAAVIMDRAIVESEVIVGAGSLVPPGKVLKSGFLYTGSPARQIRALSAKERDYFDYSAAHYVKLAERHRTTAA